MKFLPVVIFVLFIVFLTVWAQVEPVGKSSKPDFVNDIYPQLEKNGCNAAICHGSQSARLKLSLFAAFPSKDFDELVKKSGGRYINFVEPEKSLLVRKIREGHPEMQDAVQRETLARELERWIKSGAPFNNRPDLVFKELRLSLPDTILKLGTKYKIKVEAVYSNGSAVDVSAYCHFESQNNDVVSCLNNNTIQAINVGYTAVWVRFAYHFATLKLMVPQKTDMKFPASESENRIDFYVNAQLKKLGIPPSECCSDAVFVRRAYLNLTGLLPSADEVRAFLDTREANKRSALIDKLLDSEGFVDFQVLKWGDLLRCKAEYPSNLWPNAVQSYARWMKEVVRSNMPFDQFARELLVSSGSNFRSPTVNFYRAFQQRTPKIIGESAGLIFLGTRYECARCHAHPKTCLIRDSQNEMGAFFGQLRYKSTNEWKEEIVYAETDAKSIVKQVTMPDGVTVKITDGEDWRQSYVDWLTSKNNPLFAKVIVNRIWYWLNGRGIVNEPDDFRDTNPPVNPELLSYLERELISHKFDLKHIFRIILNSETWQRSSVPNRWNQNDRALFSHFLLRRLTAEEMIDAVCEVSGVPESYSSNVPEPFTFMPEGFRAGQLYDGTVSTSFLEMFGRPSRDVSYEGDRNNVLTSQQILHWLNSSQIMEKLNRSQKLRALSDHFPDKEKLIDEIYLQILSRFPTSKEKISAQKYLEVKNSDKYKGTADLAWALFNTGEFIYNH